MSKKEIIDLMETNELYYLKSLVEQVKDNLNDLNELAMKEKRAEIPSKMVLYELERIGQRSIDMLNMSDDLINTARERKEQAIRKLYKAEEVK